MNSGLVPNKPYPVELLVKNKGYAVQNDFYQIYFLPAITSISSNQGIVYELKVKLNKI